VLKRMGWRKPRARRYWADCFKIHICYVAVELNFCISGRVFNRASETLSRPLKQQSFDVDGLCEKCYTFKVKPKPFCSPKLCAFAGGLGNVPGFVELGG
jgi:hypothetical protein